MNGPDRGGGVGLFLLLTLLLSGPFWALIMLTGRTGGGEGAYATGLMWAPGLAALAVCSLRRLPLSSLGFCASAPRWLGLAWTLPLAYVSVAYGAVWAAGLGVVPDPALAPWIRRSLGWTGASDALAIAGWALLTATTGLVGGAARALGEEIGWRGFLSPRLAGRFGWRAGALVTGLIWTAWHLPILLFADYNGGAPWWWAIGCFTILVLGLSVILAWLRLRSASLWPAVLLHAGHNLFIQSLFTPVTGPRGPLTAYAIDEFGFAVPSAVALLALAFLLWGGPTSALRLRDGIVAFEEHRSVSGARPSTFA